MTQRFASQEKPKLCAETKDLSQKLSEQHTFRAFTNPGKDLVCSVSALQVEMVDDSKERRHMLVSSRN